MCECIKMHGEVKHSSCCPEKSKPHVHAELIKAWADGAVIQTFSNRHNLWHDIPNPIWSKFRTYRVKPATVVLKFRVFLWKALGKTDQQATICICSWGDNLQENREEWSGFVKWIGPWKEVEL